MADPSPILAPVTLMDGVVQLNWTSVPNGVAYSVFQTDPSGVETRLIRNCMTRNYTIRNLSDGEWGFRVRTVYLSRFGAFSNMEYITIGQDLTVVPEINLDNLNLKNLGIGIGIVSILGALIFGIIKLRK